MRIHLDPAIALAADSPTNMMPWNGDKRILIDRSAVICYPLGNRSLLKGVTVPTQRSVAVPISLLMFC